MSKIRVEGRIRNYIKEKIKCPNCKHEQKPVYPCLCDKLECISCGCWIWLYSHYIDCDGNLKEAPKFEYNYGQY